MLVDEPPVQAAIAAVGVAGVVDRERDVQEEGVRGHGGQRRVELQDLQKVCHLQKRRLGRIASLGRTRFRKKCLFRKNEV